MSNTWFDCPYCESEISLDIDVEDQGRTYVATCNKCEKKYEWYYGISIDVYPSKIEEKLNE